MKTVRAVYPDLVFFILFVWHGDLFNLEEQCSGGLGLEESFSGLFG
jgi:hypothetical protein